MPTQPSHIQKDTSQIVKYLPCCDDNITLKIRIFHNDEVIRVYHAPQNVVVKPEAKKVEIHDVNGIRLETYDLIEKKLSWLEAKDIDTAEIMLDLKISR